MTIMKNPLLPMIAGFLAILLPVRAEDSTISSPPVNPAGPVPSEARRLALETVSPVAKQGFRIRDGEWSVELTKGEPRFLQVTLFAGERYLFAAASPLRAGKLRLSLFDAEGKEVKAETPEEADPVAGGRSTGGIAEIAPTKSGNYFVGVELLESPGTGSCEVSLIYAYK